MTVGADASSQPLPPADQPKPNSFQRILGVFFSPGETMESVARRPDIAVPLIVVMVITLVTGILFAPRVDFGAPAREKMEEQGKVPPDQIDRIANMSNTIGKIISYCSPIVNVIFITILSAIFLFAFRIMGGEGDFKRAFAIVTYSWFIPLLKGLVMTIILVVRGGTVGAQELETVVRSNPAFLVDMKTNPALFSLLTNIDVFTFWWLFILILGFAAMSRFSKAKAATIIISLWLIKVVVSTGLAALGGMRSKSA